MKPEDLRYNESHEWVGLSGEGDQQVAVIGVTDFALEQLTDLVYMALPDVGASVKRGEEFGEVESVKAVSPLYSPVDGEVVEVHSELVDQLDGLSEDPYGNGWFIKVKLPLGATLDGLLTHDQYRDQCAQS